MKILYVSQYFPPEMGAPAARAAELSRHWAAMGHDVSVLTGFPNHPTGVIPPGYKKQFRKGVVHEKIDGVHVSRTLLLPFPNRKAHQRMLNYSSFCVSAAITGMFLQKPDVVIATSPQLLVGLSGWWIARRKRVPFVFEVRDLWPESLAAVGMGKPDSTLHRTLGKIAGFLYRHSDRIVAVTPAFEEYLVNTGAFPAKKISVIENGVETDLFTPQPLPRLEKGTGRDRKVRRLLYRHHGHGARAGNNPYRRRAIARPEPEIVFLLLGEGADKIASSNWPDSAI